MMTDAQLKTNCNRGAALDRSVGKRLSRGGGEGGRELTGFTHAKHCL